MQELPAAVSTVSVANKAVLAGLACRRPPVLVLTILRTTAAGSAVTNVAATFRVLGLNKTLNFGSWGIFSLEP